MNNIKTADWTRQDIAKAHNELNKTYFKNGTYALYPSFYKLKEAILFILKEENTNYNSKLKLLDCGCGCAWAAVYLQKENIKNIEYIGLDISESMCNCAKENFPEANFIVHDISKDSLLCEYDIVMEAAVLELVPLWENAFHNMLSSSKKWVILHRLFVTKADETIIQQVETYLNVPDMRAHISKKVISELCEKEGFEIIKEDIWESNSDYVQGTFVLRRK